jgi:hypothetical protein
MKKIAVLAVCAMATVAFAQTGTDFANYNSGSPTGSEFVTSFGAEGGPSALLYNDRPAGHGGIEPAGMQLALTRLGYTVTFTNSSPAFSGMIGAAGSWGVVVSGHHNTGASSHDAALSAYVSGGGRAVVEDWRSTAGTPPVYSFGSVAGPNNYFSATPVAGGRLAGALGGGAIPFFNSGWGIVNNTVSSAGGTQELTSALGTNAGLTNGFGGADKNLFLSGLNDDTIGNISWDPALAQDLYSAMILNTPEPTTVMLLGLGALGILRRRR